MTEKEEKAKNELPNEAELSKQLQEISEQKKQAFLQDVEASSKRNGWTLGAQIFVLQDGRLACQLNTVPRQI